MEKVWYPENKLNKCFCSLWIECLNTKSRSLSKKKIWEKFHAHAKKRCYTTNRSPRRYTWQRDGIHWNIKSTWFTFLNHWSHACTVRVLTAAVDNCFQFWRKTVNELLKLMRNMSILLNWMPMDFSQLDWRIILFFFWMFRFEAKLWLSASLNIEPSFMGGWTTITQNIFYILPYFHENMLDTMPEIDFKKTECDSIVINNLQWHSLGLSSFP